MPLSDLKHTMLALCDISFSYDRQVLTDISLTVRAGEIVALLGPNGAGKSTLLGIASGALRAQQGQALLNGREVHSFARREIARQMALVAQSGELRFPLTALECVLAGRFVHGGGFGFDAPQDVAVALTALAATDAAHLATRKFNELSSGERQRIVLARALAQEPKFLLLDEPTANLDIGHQVELLTLIRRLTQKQQLGALFVTHEINLAAEFADQVALLKQGRLLASGAVTQVMTTDRLSELFDTSLLVDTHPYSGRPRVTIAGSAGTI